MKTKDFGVIPYHNKGYVILGNVCALNEGCQPGICYDNSFFGSHPSKKINSKPKKHTTNIFRPCLIRSMIRKSKTL
ncbi:MAG: hypothetical protein ACUVWN_01065 [bacterium]